MTSYRQSQGRSPVTGAVATALVAALALACTVHAASPAPGTRIVNRVLVHYADANGSPCTPVTAEAEVTVGAGALLSIHKLESSDPVAPGATLRYTLQVANPGNAPAHQATVLDPLSDYVVFVAASAGGAYTPGPPGGGTVRWDLGTLPAGATGTLTVDVRVRTPADYAAGDPAAIRVGTTIPNTARLTADEGQAEDAITTTVGTGPTLEIEKTASPGHVPPGGTVSYGLTVRNTGNSTASAVALRDALPTGTAYVDGSASPAARLDGRTLAWDLGSLEPGQTASVTFQAHVSPLAAAGDTIRNTAAVTSPDLAAPALSNGTSTPVLAYTGLSVQKLDAPDPVFAGDRLTYTVRVANDGDLPLTDVRVSDPLPAKTTFVSADNGGTLAAGTVTWHLAALPPGAAATVTLVVAVSASAGEGDVIANSATVVSNETPLPVGSAVTTVSARTPGSVHFTDAAGNAVRTYRVGDAIGLSVTDPDRNTDPTARDTVTVVVTSSLSGDREVLTLLETGPATGVFTGSLPSQDAALPGSAGDGILDVQPRTRLDVTYTDPLDVVPVHEDAALVDPFGIVFDSGTGDPLAGATVTLRTDTGALASTVPGWPAGQADSVTTGADGAFAFPLVPPGTYYYQVVAPAGYTFPSTVANADLPAGFIVDTGSRGERFTLVAGQLPLVLDLPMDGTAADLEVTKIADTETAQIGDQVGYLVTVANHGTGTARDLHLRDIMPAGLQYLPGSTRLGKAEAPDPTVDARHTLVWALPDLAPGATLELTYRALVGADGRSGELRNTVVAEARAGGAAVHSNRATCKLRVTGGVFTDRGTVLGRVFHDANGNTTPDAGEVGIPRVTLYLEDGTWVTTDRHGQYSISGVSPGTHVLRLDQTTLPPGLLPAPVGNRFMGSTSSQFVDLPAGGLMKANFAVTGALPKSLEPKPASPVGSPPAAPAASTPPPAALPVPATDLAPIEFATDAPGTAAPSHPVAPSRAQLDRDVERSPSQAELEERMATLTPDLGFLSPADGAVLARGHTNVLVKAPLGSSVALSVNGQPVGEDRIGRRLTHEARRLLVLEYVSVDLKPASTNQIVAEVRDGFGNVRGTRMLTVEVVGAAAQLDLQADRTEAPADGASVVRVTATVRDIKGRPIPYVAAVTVDPTGGEVVEVDADPASPGHQIACTDGVASFGVRAPREPRQVTVTVAADGRTAHVELEFLPHLRKLLVTGVGEVVIGRGHGRNDLSMMLPDWYEDGGYMGGRGALFVKGEVAPGTLLTAAYDSHKPERTDFFRQGETEVDADDRYPILGDESTVGYDAKSRDKLYLRVDRRKSYLLYGDYNTDLTDTLLTRYQRTFTGLKAEVREGGFSGKFFAARTDQKQTVDVLPGRGISGYYYLNQTPVVEGSERLAVEVRDRRVPDHVVKRQDLAHGTDYEIDYEFGSVLFKQPVPSHDADFNPVYVVAVYEARNPGDKNYVFGGRGAYQVSKWLTLGATGVVEQQDVHDNQMLGTDATLTLPGNTTVKAELAQTDTFFTLDNVNAPRDGQAQAVELTSKPLAELSLKAFYRDADEFYNNPSATDLQRGTRRYGARAEYDVTETTRLFAEHTQDRDGLHDMEHQRSAGGVEQRLGRAKATLEVSHESSDDGYITQANSRTPFNAPTVKSPFDISADTPEDLTAVRARLETPLRKNLTLQLEHQQDIERNVNNQSTAGLELRLSATSRLYLREQYATFADRDEMRTAFGGEVDVSRNTTGFSEYRLADGLNGPSTQQSIGLRYRLKLADGLTGNATAENVTTLSGTERPGEPDAVAVTGALEYLPNDRLKLTTRAELRDATNETSYLGEAGAALKLSRDYALLTKARYFRDDFVDSGTRTTSRIMLGLAYRPHDHDRFQALTRLEYKLNDDSTGTLARATDCYIGSTEGVYQFTRTTQLVGKYAGKLSLHTNDSAYTDLVSARLTQDLTERFDVSVIFRLFQAHEVGTVAHGGALELGYRMWKNLWISVGYSLDRFDADLTGQDYEGRGAYVRLRFKFDEQTLREVREATGTP